MDIPVLLAGGGLAAAGMILGRIIAIPHRPRHKLIKPICGCKHHRSFHEDGKGRCSWLTKWDRNQCPCEVYSGPITLPELSAQDFPGG